MQVISNKYRRGWKESLVLATDIFLIIFCYVASYFIRFDGMPPEKYLDIMIKIFPLVLISQLMALFYFKLHKSIWHYASIRDLTQIIKAVSISSVVIVAFVMVLHIGHPRSVFIIDWLLLIIGLSGVRFIIRLTRPIRRRQSNSNGNGRRKKLLIVGAGDAGEMILRDVIYRYGRGYDVIGIIDDDYKKHRRRIHGVTVLGTRSDIPDIVRNKNVEEIIIAIPSLAPDQMRDIVNFCIKSGAKYRTVPSISDVIGGTIKVKELREIRIEDLLKRDEVFLNRGKIESYIREKSVLITGAGGSIGSELARQVARLSPGKLILFEKSENVLFYIDMELGDLFPAIRKTAVIGDICDKKRVEEVFAKCKPQIIFHAAAHKHVPLMEKNSMEAIKNNVFGTKVIVDEAINCGVERFIMLSTDKAVEPTSLMGVSKKISEMLVTSLAKKHQTKFMAVRFGNVLGSEGSVIPTFKKQIEKGGPVTITHPDIKRYFMTIAEAAGLVMEAGAIGQGGEIFILEMGRQIKIVDLARDMIKLSGLKPSMDIKIKFTGLRPGEKMYEALIADNEVMFATDNKKIMVLEAPKENQHSIFEDIKTLEEIVGGSSMNMLIEKLKEIVPDYRPSRQILGVLQKAKDLDREINILIVDDEKIVQDLLRKFLDGRGYNTLLASNGRKALDVIKTNNVQIAIIDIKLSGFMDGLQLLKHIKKINGNIEVIIITGFSTERTKKLSRRLGAYAYLEKPFDLADVRRHIEDALNKVVS